MQRIFHPSRPSEEDKANSGEILSLFKCYCVNSIWLNKRSVGGIKRIRTSKPLNLVMFWLSTLSQRELTKTLFVRLLCWPECFTSMNSVSILSWWWPCRVFGGALWPFLLPWPIDFPNKAEGARTRAPIVHFNPCNFFPSRRRNNWSRPKSGGGESHKGLNYTQVGRGGEGWSHILQEA